DFSAEAQKADLILSVGVKAAEAVAGKTRTPLLAAMIPHNRYPDLAAKQQLAQISAIYVDQPWSRQAELIRAALPERSKVGVLYSQATRLDLNDLRKQLEIRGATLVARQIGSSARLFEDLEDILARSEVLLAVPDSEIYNSNNIRNILLTSYRHGIPLVGISQAYVNAGALCALFSTPEQLAVQARTMVIAYAQNRSLPEAQYPAMYSIAVNQEVARTLGDAIKPAELLRKEIDKSKRTAQ
ncbi:MAG: ABC transporter substrate binding protein, partial [Sterolibacterium sp.]